MMPRRTGVPYVEIIPAAQLRCQVVHWMVLEIGSVIFEMKDGPV